MQTNKRLSGKLGEDAVCAYLIQKGYSITARNYCIRGGELDIIAENGEYIVFVEVKARKPHSMVSGIEAVTDAKKRRIITTAAAYSYKNPLVKQPRFDIAEVTLCGGLAKNIEYYENAFDMTGCDDIMLSFL